jgi:catechol-2,3-dioxygenase
MSTAIEKLGDQARSLPPLQITEVVLQTSHYEEMRAWYPAVLGITWGYENTPKTSASEKYKPGDKQVRASDVRASFTRVGGAGGVTLALFELPWLSEPNHKEPGLNHLQFTEKDLDALMARIELLRDAGVHPHRSSNHGPVLSFYFKDPDGNIVEFCSRNFETAQEMQTFVASEAFRNNPSGIEIERDEFLERYRRGVPPKELLQI